MAISAVGFSAAPLTINDTNIKPAAINHALLDVMTTGTLD